jgi:hypothetical protein
MTSVTSHLSIWQRTRGLLAAAAVAWALTTLIDLGWPILQLWFASTFLQYDGYVPPLAQVVSWIALYAIFGLPLALIVCLAIGFPAWRFAEKKGLATRLDAVRVGAVVALIIGLTGIILGVLASLSTALNDSSTFDSWSWGRQVVRDGLPTPLGWVFTAIDLLATVGIGCVAGYAAWTVAGVKSTA